MNKKINFAVSPKYIIDLMERQTEGLDKALAELVMNSADAGAKSVYITMQADPYSGEMTFSVEDDGRGFSKKDIMEYFRLFGEPHESGDATYGAFRLGRSQALTLAKTEWHTRSYIMKVDIRSALDNKDVQNLGFELVDSDRKVKGCHIKGTLYQKRYYIDDIESSLKRLIEFMPLPVYFNQRLITTPIRELKRSQKNYFQDDVAHYFLDQNATGLRLYNQGVIVDYPSFKTQLAKGIVISKKPFALDHSRRIALKENCPVLQQMDNALSAFADKQCLNLDESDINDLDSYMREAINHLAATEIQYCKALDYFVTKRVLRDHYGNEVSLQDLFAVGWIGSCNDTGPRTERVATLENVTLLWDHSKSLHYHLNIEGGGSFFWRFLSFANRCCRVWLEHHPEYAAQHDYQDFMHFQYDLADEKYQAVYKQYSEDSPDYQEYSTLHQYLLAMNEALHPLISGELEGCAKREITMGDSNEADAWTDGSSYIAFNAKTCKRYLENDNLIKLVMLLLHEYCHDSESGNGHGRLFYLQFHNLAQRIDYGKLVSSIEQTVRDKLLAMCA